MIYKTFLRKEVKLTLHQANVLRALVRWLRKKHGITRVPDPVSMFKNQMLDEFEKLSQNVDKKLLLEQIEKYEAEHEIRFELPSEKERRKIKGE